MALYIGNNLNNIAGGTNLADSMYGYGGNDQLYGYGGNDYLNGGIGNDYLNGGTGDDFLFGDSGNDTMVGGAGADQFVGGSGIDAADYRTSTTAVTAYLHSNQSGGDAAGDTYSGMENVIGSAYNDRLQNNGGGTAYGQGGNDILYGGGAQYSAEEGGYVRGDTGIDTLRMDYGATSAWLQNGLGADIVDQFIEGQDNFYIDLSDFGLGSSLTANEIVNNNTHTAVGGNAQLIYDGDDSKLYLDTNGSGAGGQTLIADLTNSTVYGGNLDAGDFQYQL